MKKLDVLELVPGNRVRSRFRPLLIGTIVAIRPDYFEILWPLGAKTFHSARHMTYFQPVPGDTP